MAGFSKLLLGRRYSISELVVKESDLEITQMWYEGQDSITCYHSLSCLANPNTMLLCSNVFLYNQRVGYEKPY